MLPTGFPSSISAPRAMLQPLVWSCDRGEQSPDGCCLLITIAKYGRKQALIGLGVGLDSLPKERVRGRRDRATHPFLSHLVSTFGA